MRNVLAMLKAALVRRAGLLIWILVVQTFVLIPVMVMALGFLPEDDCLRHAAKAVDGRAWGEILILRPGILEDPHVAWNAILRGVHLATQWGPEALVVLTVVGLFLLVFLAPLPWFKAPEAWPASWVILWVAGGAQARFMMGRPFLFMTAALLALMALWTRGARSAGSRLVLSILLFGAAALLHGSWYLLVMIPFCFLLAGRWREGWTLLLAWAAGCLLAALATGHPVGFLWGELEHMGFVMAGGLAPGALVPELGPFSGTGPIALGLLGVLFLRLRQGREASLLRDPLFLMVLLGWVLGLRVQRFWIDWGYPCAALWLAFQLEPILVDLRARAALLPLGLAAGLCLAATFLFTEDAGARWSSYRSKVFLTADRPGMAGWLPEPGGILYSRTMATFFDTYFKNPHGAWRYMVGFEPSMMPAEDLAIYRRILANPRDPATMLPWVARMRPQDRLCTGSGRPEPGLFGLEWHWVGGDLWLGRLPRPPAQVQAP